MAKAPAGFGPKQPQVVVLFGATGDLARRRLLPGLFHLATAGFIPSCQIVGVSLDDLSRDHFRDACLSSLREFYSRGVNEAQWEEFSQRLDFVSTSAGPAALSAAVKRAEGSRPMQFAMHDTGLQGDVLEAYERLILDAMRGDGTLFTTADGIERVWEVSTPLLESPPPVRLYEPGSWGPNAVHQLVAPHAWRLPFERAWRSPNKLGS